MKRRCERKFQSIKLSIDKQIYYQACRNYNRFLEVSKTNYLKEKFSTFDMKQLFRLVGGMFSVRSFPNLPTHDSLEHLVESFGDYFESKIIDIRRSLSQQPSSRPNCVTNVWCSTSFGQFDHVSPNGVKTIIQSSKSKSCALDPIPTWLLKDCIDVLLPTLTDIMNASLDQSIFPSFFKKTLIFPLIKKDNLDADVFGSGYFHLFLQEVTNFPSDKKRQP